MDRIDRARREAVREAVDLYRCLEISGDQLRDMLISIGFRREEACAHVQLVRTTEIEPRPDAVF